MCLNRTRSAQEPRFPPHCCLAKGSSVLQPLEQDTVPGFTADTDVNHGGGAETQLMLKPPIPTWTLHSHVPNYQKPAHSIDPRVPEETLGQCDRTQASKQRALTHCTKHKQLGLKAITSPWMFSTGSLASGRT